MINLKRFIDKVSSCDNKNMKHVTLTLQEAKSIKDDLAKLLLELNELNKQKESKETELIRVEIKGKDW